MKPKVLEELQAVSAKVVVSGVGSATVYASESVDATTSGVGNITVHGNPEGKTTNSSGVGKINFK